MPQVLPGKKPRIDFFVADILDAAPKNDMASMEHPVFALRAGDKRIRTYSHGGTTLAIKPGFAGCATIHDKDIWIYCISQMVEALNRGRDVDRCVRFTAYNFLVTTNRDTSGSAYIEMIAALSRLQSTSIETNIETSGRRERRGFGLIESWKVIEESMTGRMVAVEVVLPEWLYRSVKSKHVLTLSQGYFQLRKPIDRRIYEIVRKHCGMQSRWRVKMCTLHKKSGSRSPLRNFRGAVKSLAESGVLPDYHAVYVPSKDSVTFYLNGSRGAKAQMEDILRSGGVLSLPGM